MSDPERTQLETDPERSHDPGTVDPGDGATLMPPSEHSPAADSPTVPLFTPTEDPSQTLAVPCEPKTTPEPTHAVMPDVPPALAPPTVAPPRFDFPLTAETLAPPESAPPASQATEHVEGASSPPLPSAVSTDSSGTLLDHELISAQSQGATDPASPVLPRATSPVPLPAQPPSAPSTIARPAAMKTGRMAALSLPKVEGYVILRELGRGGMGVVYEARQEGLNRIVALKMVLAAGRASADELARFRAEAEAVAHLQHPNIVQVYDVGTHDGLPFFSLEYCSGGTLADHTGGRPQPPRRAARIIHDLARAIHHAHQRLILHRDLKPANVLLAARDGTVTEPGERASDRKTHKLESHALSEANPDKTTVPASPAARRSGSVRRHSRDAVDVDLEHCVPKITDFGLAKRLEGDAGKTRDGSVMGTPSYMAPEQAQGKVRELGPPADVYALGAILYDMLTGNPPFRGDTVMDTLHQVINKEPVAPQRLHAKIPVDLDTICLKCLEKDPSKRYASADALAEDLRRFLEGEPILARPTPWWEKTLKWARRRPAAAMLAQVSTLANEPHFTGG
jgi:serine/threonine protein kinase